jgi:VanZ family protein
VIAFSQHGRSDENSTLASLRTTDSKWLTGERSEMYADSTIPNKKRIWLVAGTQAGLWLGSFVALNKLWYDEYPRTSFHFFNDNREWNQMDKLGHVFTTFQVSNISSKMWQWAGLSHKRSVIYGAISGIAYQSVIEIQDAYSAEWGFSLSDMGSNFLGAAMFVAQELTWEEKRIRLKLSFSNHDYPKEVTARYEHLFGSTFIERYLKDYNSQTYWVSVNPRSFLTNSRFPGWLNIAAGYSSDLMLGGRENVWTDKEGVFFDRRDIPRTRRFYLSPDVDFTRIPTNSKLLKTVFQLIGGIKFPAPALELNSKGKFRAHLFYF